MDERLSRLVEAAAALEQGRYHAVPALPGADEVAELSRSLGRLGEALEKRFQESANMARVSETVNQGLVVEEVLNHIYDSFRPLIPYDRIGFALIEGDKVRAHWSRSDYEEIAIFKGYCLPLAETSLEAVANSHMPRIINDLQVYAEGRPKSKSARAMLAEGIRSSLTCPLRAMGRVLGFLFFSSRRSGAYADAHASIFLQLAGQISIIVEKSRLHQDLAAAVQMRDRWVGMAAHDLRNPLTSIQGYLTLFQRGALGPLTEKQKRVMERMLRACGTMLELINDLLEVSAIESGSLELEYQDVSLREFLGQCQESVELQAEGKGVAIEAIAQDDERTFRCDPRRLGQAVTNLLTNAIKFSPRDAKVRLSGFYEAPKVRIEVQDEGVGISPEDLDRLFRPFSRASSRPTEGESSTGLGLSIVKRIVEAHRGEVWVKSRPGDGSVFILTVPASPAPGS